jgi:hypothetical protein
VNISENTEKQKEKQFAFISLMDPSITLVKKTHIKRLNILPSFFTIIVKYSYEKIKLLAMNPDSQSHHVEPTEINWVEIAQKRLYKVVEQLIQLEPSHRNPSIRGGKEEKKVDHVKTTQKLTCKDGIERVLYKKGDSMYVKKKSTKTGKMTFNKVKL